jgi:hypothetical protein
MTGQDHAHVPGQGPGTLIADVLAGVSRLVQGELALARAEATERLQSAKQAVVQVVVAAVLGITAINLLAAGAVAALVAFGMSTLWASVTVGVVLLLLALGFAQHAARLLRAAGEPPRRAAASLRRDVEILQTMVKPDATA